MSEATRQRWLFIHNRLEELAAKYGPPDETMPEWLDHADLDPSWGPVGSLLARYATPGPAQPVEPSKQPDAQNHVLEPVEGMSETVLPGTAVHLA